MNQQKMQLFRVIQALKIYQQKLLATRQHLKISPILSLFSQLILKNDKLDDYSKSQALIALLIFVRQFFYLRNSIFDQIDTISMFQILHIFHTQSLTICLYIIKAFLSILMARPKTVGLEPKQNQKKTKKVQKGQKKIAVDNKIIIKKLVNQKEVIAEFPLIPVQKGEDEIAIPMFRRDGLDFTPGFSLPDQFTKPFQNEQRMLQDYRIASQTTEIDVENIKEPKPSARNSYCTICKIRFEDYKEHINLQSHSSKMKSSYYNKLIQELCQKKKIQRFFMNAKKNVQTSEEQKTMQDTDVFLSNEFPESVNFGSSKEFLYQKIKKQYRQHSLPISDQNLFDVLQL